ncbi:putative phage abortive infection protein [Pedobacter quisquiliarum]|nr:putative phage abortive infection protein [Pedobacter quisquiliarum]
MKKEFETILAIYSNGNQMDRQGFEKCYKLFFFGLTEFEKSYPHDTSFIEVLYNARRNHEQPSKQSITTNKARKEFSQTAQLYFNYKPYSGHEQRLGHYFRHLFLTVKTIANSELIPSYEQKMKFLKILRAQLSNHEQVLLFYNWLGGFGNNWENDKNSFFAEYGMIHNLPHNTLFHDKYITDNINHLRNTKVNYRKGNMFEIDRGNAYLN